MPSRGLFFVYNFQKKKTHRKKGGSRGANLLVSFGMKFDIMFNPICTGAGGGGWGGGGGAPTIRNSVI